MLRALIITLMLFAIFTPVASAAPPDPWARSAKTKRMYACNKQPASWSKAELRCVVRIGFGSEAHNAEQIVSCESVWNPRAVSRTDDHGLFQINRRWNSEGWRRGANIYDPVWNTRIARWFWQTRGWDDWACSHIMGVS